MKKQRGFGGIEIVIILAIVGAVIGAWVYHEAALAGLKTEVETQKKIVKDKQDTINNQAADIGTLKGSEAALKIANQNFKDLADAQNRSIANIRKERDDALAKWDAAMKLAASHSIEYQRSIDKIMTTTLKPGQTWCDGFTELMTAYIKERKGAK